MRRSRRISQLVFFALFISLFLLTRYPYKAWTPSDIFIQSSPLSALVVLLASRSFYVAMLIAAGVLLLTIPLGRFFCGWICPLGTIIDADDKLFKPRERQGGGARLRRVKYFILIFVLAAALFSVQLGGYVDPLALLWRSVAIVVYPVIVFILSSLFQLLFRMGIFEDAVYTFYDAAQRTILPVEQPHFQNGGLILLIFAAILVLAVVSRRFWCRNLCPLGAMLGFFSKHRLTKRVVDASCNQCGVCLTSCRMNAVGEDFVSTNIVECIECGECVDLCPERAVHYSFGLNPPGRVDFSRRRVLQAGLLGFSGAALAKTVGVNRNDDRAVIRPPGALEEEKFLDACIRCQECVKICASTGAGLQPSFLEAGWEGVWTPVLAPRLGYCEFNCVLCGQVCPTDAIRELSLSKKQKLKIGRAVFDKNLCIPWAEHKDCLVCEEHCPTPDKAIKFDVRDVELPQGGVRTVKLPYVEEHLCIGCGICETKCPIIGKAGIFIISIGKVQKEAVL